MPLSLRMYLKNAVIFGAVSLLMMIGMPLTVAINNPAPAVWEIVVTEIFALLFMLPLTVYHLYKFVTLRRTLTNVEPRRGVVGGWRRGAGKGSARLVIMDGEHEYTTPAIFTAGQACRWDGCAVEFALVGREVLVLRVEA